MSVAVRLKSDSEVGQLIALLQIFGNAHDGVEFHAKLPNVPNVTEQDLEMIVVAQDAIEKALASNNYAMAKVAYQVMDCTLRKLLEPAITVSLNLDDETSVWAQNGGDGKVTKAQLFEIGQAVNDVRMKARFGLPEEMDANIWHAVQSFAKS